MVVKKVMTDKEKKRKFLMDALLIWGLVLLAFALSKK